MRRVGPVLIVVVAALGVTAPVAAQEVPEATRNVANAAQWRQALTALSAVTSGTNTITITADIEFNGSAMPTYTGTRPLVVEGQDHTIDVQYASRLLLVISTAKVTIRDLIATNGVAIGGECGGLIRSAGNVVFEDGGVYESFTQDEGGAFCVDGNLTITRSEVSDNSTIGPMSTGIGGQGGGAISVGGNLTIRDSNLLSNRTGGTVGGGAVWAHGGSVTIERSTFTGNLSLGEDTPAAGLLLAGNGPATITDSDIGGSVTQRGPGAAIYAGSNVDLTVTRGTFSGNRVEETIATGLTNGGAAIQAEAPITVDGTFFSSNEVQRGQGGALNLQAGGTIRNARFLNNKTTKPVTGMGGAVFSDSEDDALLITDSTFEANTTAAPDGHGGAIALRRGTISGSHFEDNAVSGANADGGALYDLDDGLSLAAFIAESTFVGNEAADDGGSISSDDAIVSVTESSVSGSTSGGDGGGMGGAGGYFLENTTVSGSHAGGRGGGLAVVGILRHVTLAGNDATGLGEQLFVPASGTLSLEASAIDAPASGVSCQWGGGSTGDSDGFNADTDDTCRLDDPTDLDDQDDLGLGAQHRVGLGVGHVPLAGSPLVDLVPAGDCAFDHDQQGVERPFEDGCDVGALERLFPDGAFTDLPNWITDAGRWLTWTGNSPQIMVGITPTTFEAGEDITRAQVVRMLYNLAGAPDASGYPDHGFTDVPGWVESAVRWAKGEGIVEGITPTTFAPDDPITRAQVVRMLHRFAGSPPTTGIDPHPFTDVPAWVQESVTWAANPDLALPIFTGITATTFVPNDPITRGQVARSTYRLSLTPPAWADAGQAPAQVIFQQNTL